MRYILLASAYIVCVAQVANAEPDDALVAKAQAQGACDPYGVADAVLDTQGRIVVTCYEEATAFVPLLGGLGPAFGLGVAAAAIANGHATPHTR